METIVKFHTGWKLTPEAGILLFLIFFNTFPLPEGMLYTTILTPLFLIYILSKKHLKSMLLYIGVSLPVIIFHSRIVEDMSVYIRSYVLLTSCFIFATAAVIYLKRHFSKLQFYFNSILIFNTIMLVVAILAYTIEGARETFWYLNPIGHGLPIVPRLKMLVYEPSFYSFQFGPILIFFLMGFILISRSKYLPGLILAAIPILLSMSFGVMGSIALAVFFTVVANAGTVLRRKQVFFPFIYLTATVAIGAVLIYQLFPFNPLVERVDMLSRGWDTSANGRTWQAFVLAWKILQETDFVLGAGIGQIKVVGHDIITQYYQYAEGLFEVVRIPNAMAETMATFGLLGLSVRLFVIIGLFFYTKVYDNFFRTALFAFVFIFQFAGSYLTNIYEYTIWIICFLPVFPRFNRENFRL